jgi:NodT family efflux transporter outer membrane factor (OMF) lipoprotein
MQLLFFHSKRISVLGLVLLLSACSSLTTTPYEPPAVSIPTAWQQQNEEGIELADRWWEALHDPVLDKLVDNVLQQNIDLAASTLQARRAQLKADQSQSDQYPELLAGGNSTFSHTSNDSEDTESQSYSLTGSLSYELDIWSKLADATKASRLEALATREDRSAVTLSLVGTVVSTYYEIAYLNHRLNLSQESINYTKRSLVLVQVQQEAGAASALEIVEAEYNLASQEASHSSLVQQLVEARNTLALLLGGPPQVVLDIEPVGINQLVLPKVHPDLPALLLSRRPDVQAAEARIRSALATTDATRASFYPTFNLTGSLGGTSSDLARLLSNPIATLAANLSLPFLQWNDMQRSIKISKIDYEQTVLTYRNTLYTAMAEVENSLSATKQYEIQREKLQRAADRAQRAESIYHARYKAGSITLKVWLDSQENRRQSDISLAENRLNQLKNYITLCKALGGKPDNNVITETGGRLKKSY